MRSVLSVLVLLGAGCAPRPGSPAAAGPAPPVAVSVAPVLREDLAREWEMAAEFRPWQEIDVNSRIAGYVKTMPVEIGDVLRPGQLIAQLEVPELQQELAQAQAVRKRSELEVVRAESEVTRAEATLRIRQLSYDRLAAVAKQRPNLIARQEIDDVAARLQEAAAQVATAKATLAAVQEQVRVSEAAGLRVLAMTQYTKVTAPFAGVVTQRYESPGAMVQGGSKPLIRLSQVDRLRLVLPVPESIVSRVKVGAPVEVRVDAVASVVQGRVMRFTGMLNRSTRSMETEVDVPNPGYTLKPGMYAYATITLEAHAGALAIPIQAIRAAGANGSEARQQLAIVNANNQIEMREVRLGLETPEWVEVVSGLNEGDRVVIGNRGDLKTGQTVEPRPLAK
ncbi:MAG: efflux RND transporter periplasmic adaptor subunit [Acidobacteriaceae bacterium]|nr:efflux RND transporter periplasmic adaptor subunit [Acidobacteriaceae bacterium]